MYSSYTAASFPRAMELAARDGVNLEGALTWAFEFEDQPLFAGFCALASDGLDLPVLNVFRMFGKKWAGQRLVMHSSAGLDAETIRLHGRARQLPRRPPPSPVLTKTNLPSLLWHYHHDNHRRNWRRPLRLDQLDHLGVVK